MTTTIQELKTAIAQAVEQTRQNRREYFTRAETQKHWDHRDWYLCINIRAMHIAIAYLQRRPFHSVERYNYSTKPEGMEHSIWAAKAYMQNRALLKANELLGHVDEVPIGGRPVKRVVKNAQFEQWISTQ